MSEPDVPNVPGSGRFGQSPSKRPVALTIITFLLLVAVLLVLIWSPYRTHELEPGRTISIYAFSAMEDALDDELLPAFRHEWQARTGEDVHIVATYAGSGTIVDRILAEVEVDVAVLSSELDALRLARRGMLPGRSWENLPGRGVISRSPVVLLVRPGNPRDILGFDDLTREGLEIICPDPKTSGAGIWAALAIYGASRLTGGDVDVARGRVRDTWRNVVAGPVSAHMARREFEEGRGDVLITYEKEALASRRAELGEPIYPGFTIMSEHVAVKLDRNVEPLDREIVDALMEYFRSTEAQRILVAHGFRSIREELNADRTDLRLPESIFTLRDLGDLPDVDSEITGALAGARR